MVRAVRFLVSVDEVSDAAPKGAATAGTQRSESGGDGGAGDSERSEGGTDAQETT
jgi:hypothetical protein